MVVRNLRIALCAIVAVQFACVGAASAAWSGSAPYFDYSNGGSDNGLFGDPVIVGGNTFVFTPDAFRADSADGVAGSATDRLFIDITMHSTYALGGVRIQEGGHYGITGTGSVNSTSELCVTDLDIPRALTCATWVTNPVFPVTSGSGNWSGSLNLDTSGDFPEWTHFRVELTNVLEAFSGAGSTSFIDKTLAGAQIQITIIPEPASLALLLLGLAVLRRR
jgi:hypothetical protein